MKKFLMFQCAYYTNYMKRSASELFEEKFLFSADKGYY